MDVLLDEDGRLLQESLRHFFAQECTTDRVRAVEDEQRLLDQPLWQQLSNLGWLGLALPAMVGGAEAPLTQVGLLFEEAGRALAPVPLHAHTVAALTVAHAGTEAQKDLLLPTAVDGSERMTWAWTEADPNLGPQAIRLRAEPHGNGWRINGTKRFVEGFSESRHLVLPVRTSEVSGDPTQGITMVVIDSERAGLTYQQHLSLAGDSQFTLTFDDVALSGNDVLGVPDEGWEIATWMLQRAVILNCAMIVGATRAAVERAVAYAKERVAFGRPIGAFQSIQHTLADLITWVDGAELLEREALWRLSEGLDAAVEVAAAKAYANERCQAALREANQIHGGVAQVTLYDQQLWYRRAAAWTMRLGTAIDHRRTIAQRLAEHTAPRADAAGGAVTVR